MIKNQNTHQLTPVLYASKLRYLLKTCQCCKIGYSSNYCDYLKNETVNYMMLTSPLTKHNMRVNNIHR